MFLAANSLQFLPLPRCQDMGLLHFLPVLTLFIATFIYWLLHGCTIPDLTSICCHNIQRKGNISFQCPLLSKRETFPQKPLEIFLNVSLPWFGLQASSRNNLINKRIPKTDLFQFLIQTVVLGMLLLESSSLTLTLARTLTFIEV